MKLSEALWKVGEALENGDIAVEGIKCYPIRTGICYSVLALTDGSIYKVINPYIDDMENSAGSFAYPLDEAHRIPRALACYWLALTLEEEGR